MAKKQSNKGAAPVKTLKSARMQQFPPNLLQEIKQSQRAIVDVLIPGYIYVVRNFLSNTECKAWVDYMEANITQSDLMQQRGTRTMAARECYRYQLNDSEMAGRIFERMKRNCPDMLQGNAVACNPNLRMYKYTKGMSFAAHYDESNKIDRVGITKYTILLYLSACEGGATRFFHDKEVAFEPQPGAMLLHLHGKDCLLHQADAVKSGVKYILRTDLVY